MRPLRLKSIDYKVRFDTKQRFVGELADQIKNNPVCRRLCREGSGLDGVSGEGTSLYWTRILEVDMQWVNVDKPRMMKQLVSLCVKSQTKNKS